MRTKEEYENALDDFEIKYQLYLGRVKKECLAECEKDLEHNLELFRELIDSIKENENDR